jgi:hypothetical protein
LSTKKSDPTQDPEFQDVVQHFLKTPLQPHKPNPKVSPGKPATKAELAAQKRVDKTVIKRMRKR